MKNTKKFLISLFIGISVSTLFSFDIPKGWFKKGSNPEEYDMGIDIGAGQNGRNAATIKSRVKRTHGFGTLMQSCEPTKYLGKRIKMTGYLKAKDVKDWASLWLRVDGITMNRSLAFDNMHDNKIDRSIKGTTDWTKCEIVLDVDNDAVNLSFGALIDGKGQIWVDNITFEVVDKSVPITGRGRSDMYYNEVPTNLDFKDKE
jgi:hypothetical protein